MLVLLAELQELNQEESEDILKIDDLLKYMGNVKVDILKSALCKILEDYDQKIS